ncbi:hypothetical protein O9K51_11158 [Purpureocillium lavendulum]|uniref:Uncharacterized protein n=1 Tax=Purpureocillium lavendulum TaxID=1247861 RepID=A0AB34FD75_9HYPO|nr:hypothetical protein O9K51_11158 [Purpureocillium lavendulum]
MASSIGNVPKYQNPSRLASNPGVDSMAQNPDALHPLRPNPPAPGQDQMRLGNRVVQLDAPSPYGLVSPMKPSPGVAQRGLGIQTSLMSHLPSVAVAACEAATTA